MNRTVSRRVGIDSDMHNGPQIDISAKEAICRVYQQKFGHIILGILKKKKFISLIIGSCRSRPSYMNLTILTNIIHNRPFWPLSEQWYNTKSWLITLS